MSSRLPSKQDRALTTPTKIDETDLHGPRSYSSRY